MQKKNPESNRPSDLRLRAEKFLSERSENIENMPVEDIRELIHQLEAHQIQLEIQNEELNRTQHELAESRNRYYDLYDFAPVGYITVGEKGLILEANLTAAELLGVERSRLIKKGFSEFIAREGQDLFYSHRRKLLETRSENTFELKLLKKTDTAFHARLDVTVVQDDEGVFNQFLIAITDITERKQAEDALKASEEKFRDLYDNAPNAYFSVSALDGSILNCNRAARRFLGYPKNTLRRMKVFDLYADTPNGLAEARKVYKRFKAGEKIEDIELEMQHANGNPIWVNLSVEPLRDRSGIVIESRSMVIDITERKRVEKELRKARDELEIRVEERTAELSGTNALLQQEISERKQAEESLRKSEKKYSRLVETSLTGIFVVQNGRIVFANNRFAEIFGYSKKELIGEQSLKIVHPEDGALLEELRKGRLSGKKAREEYDIRGLKKDGTTIWTRRRVTLTQYKGSPAILGNVVNITHAKQMEENLRKSEENLRTLSSQLLAAQEEERKRVALELHDGIGQSLSAIKYRVETALREMKGEKRLRGFDSLSSIVPMVQGAVEEVRRIQKDLRPSILDDLGILATLSWLCREFEAIYSTIHIEKQIDIQEDDVPEPLKIAIYRISQEALNNIAKHSHAHLIRFSLERSHSTINLSIDDDGVGFDVEKALTEAASTRGLGLSGMRERTQFSGGTFRIESREGAGTAVQASWPVTDRPR